MLRSIKPGSLISVIAPAFSANPDKTEKGIQYLRDRGFKIKSYESLYSSWKYFSALDEQRAMEINDSFADPRVAAIICARGGWGSLRLLDLIDYDLIRINPKALIGFSDITSLQLAIWSKSNIPSISGPMAAVEMANGLPLFTEQFLWDQISNTSESFTVDLKKLTAVSFLKQGYAKGKLLGGCLSLIAHLLGTPYCPSFKNNILFLEDIGEDMYKIDRYLAHLKQADIFRQISGLIVGQFIDCEDNSKPNFTTLELFEYYTREIEGPVLYNFPYGHIQEKVSIPVGAGCTLKSDSSILTFENLFYHV